MITDEQLEEKEAEVTALFFGAVDSRPKTGSTHTPEEQRRVEQIMVRVRVEALMKETAGFVFQTFGATMSGVLRAMFGILPGSESPPSPDGKEDTNREN